MKKKSGQNEAALGKTRCLFQRLVFDKISAKWEADHSIPRRFS